jgi:DNA-binding transcriptional LysR family regulator
MKRHAAEGFAMGIADLQSLDVSNLMVLRQLLTDCSVTRVAERLNLPQPSVSRLLRRLRVAFADPLLVRSGSGFVPTERGVAVREALADVLQRLDGIAAAKTAFAPAEATRVFSIACADCLAVALVPRIIAAVAAAGPGLRVRFRSIDPAFDVFQALKAGEIDLVIDNSPSPQESLRLAPLYRDEVVLMMRRGHPAAAAGRLTLENYLTLRHLAPHPSSLRDAGPIDGELARGGYRRIVHATVPEFNLVPYVLAETDLVFTTGRRFAEHHARHLPIEVVPAPSFFPAMHFHQLWHDRTHFSPAIRWLRSLVMRAVRETDAEVAEQASQDLLRRRAT